MLRRAAVPLRHVSAVVVAEAVMGPDQVRVGPQAPAELIPAARVGVVLFVLKIAIETVARPRGRPADHPGRVHSSPLSKDALAGTVPLRTFGQLKQLWEARVDEPSDMPGDAGQGAAGDRPASAPPQDQSRQEAAPSSTPSDAADPPSNPE